MAKRELLKTSGKRGCGNHSRNVPQGINRATHDNLSLRDVMHDEVAGRQAAGAPRALQIKLGPRGSPTPALVAGNAGEGVHAVQSAAARCWWLRFLGGCANLALCQPPGALAHAGRGVGHHHPKISRPSAAGVQPHRNKRGGGLANSRSRTARAREPRCTGEIVDLHTCADADAMRKSPVQRARHTPHQVAWPKKKRRHMAYDRPLGWPDSDAGRSWSNRFGNSKAI